MATTHLSQEQLKDFKQKVNQTAMKFPADVVRIRHSFSDDWDGDPAIFFRILLTDDAHRRTRLADLTDRVGRELINDLGLAESEYTPYFYYRSKSEQEKMSDPEWE